VLRKAWEGDVAALLALIDGYAGQARTEGAYVI